MGLELSTDLVYKNKRLSMKVELLNHSGDDLITDNRSITNKIDGNSFIRFKNSSGKNVDIKIEDLYNKWMNGRPHQKTDSDRCYVRKRIKLRKLRVMNEDSGIFEFGNIDSISYAGEFELFRIECQKDKFIVISKDTKVWTKNGFKSIRDGLTSTDFIGLNGSTSKGCQDYRDFNSLKNSRDSGLSVSEMAERYECSYHTIRKWLKIHGLQFNKEETYFKKGQKPWNNGVNGYTLNLTEGGLKSKRDSKNRRKGKDSHFWRGGITSERGLIGQWTRSVARAVHEKYGFCCQNCGGESGEGKQRTLNAHHILPVCTHPEHAYDINNLVTICRKCHEEIHSTPENEILFASKFLSEDIILKSKFGKNKINRFGRRLHVHFSKITKINSIGIHKSFYVEINGKFKNFVVNGVVIGE